MGNLRGKHVLKAGTDAFFDRGKGLRTKTLKDDLDVSDAAAVVVEETGELQESHAGMMYVIRGDWKIYFWSRNAVDVTPCTCGGRGVVYEKTDVAAGGRGRCCLNCFYGKK
jgi:hypothetical protein